MTGPLDNELTVVVGLLKHTQHTRQSFLGVNTFEFSQVALRFRKMRPTTPVRRTCQDDAVDTSRLSHVLRLRMTERVSSALICRGSGIFFGRLFFRALQCRIFFWKIICLFSWCLCGGLCGFESWATSSSRAALFRKYRYVHEGHQPPPLTTRGDLLAQPWACPRFTAG